MEKKTKACDLGYPHRKRLAKDIEKEEPVRWKENQKTDSSGKCDEKEGATSCLRCY